MISIQGMEYVPIGEIFMLGSSAYKCVENPPSCLNCDFMDHVACNTYNCVGYHRHDKKDCIFILYDEVPIYEEVNLCNYE